MSNSTTIQRRRLLRFLATSPLMASPAFRAMAAEAGLASATDALDVFDFEAAARQIVPPAHWGYLQSGVDGDVTRDANQSAYAKWQLIPRRFVDVSRVDLATTVFGTALASPVMISPIGGLRALHMEADIGVARAAKAKNQLQVVSTQMSDVLEDIAAARGAPLWFQLYTTNRLEVTRALVQRAARAGCSVVAVTVDLPAGRPQHRDRDTAAAAGYAHLLQLPSGRRCGQPASEHCQQANVFRHRYAGSGTGIPFAGMGFHPSAEGHDSDEGGDQGHRG